MLEKMREINIPHKTNDAADYVTISIGGTTDVINHLQHGSDYIKTADKALYESKKNGRNRYTFYKNAWICRIFAVPLAKLIFFYYNALLEMYENF